MCIFELTSKGVLVKLQARLRKGEEDGVAVNFFAHFGSINVCSSFAKQVLQDINIVNCVQYQYDKLCLKISNTKGSCIYFPNLGCSQDAIVPKRVIKNTQHHTLSADSVNDHQNQEKRKWLLFKKGVFIINFRWREKGGLVEARSLFEDLSH
mgnify:CR=1 FL=1